MFEYMLAARRSGLPQLRTAITITDLDGLYASDIGNQTPHLNTVILVTNLDGLYFNDVPPLNQAIQVQNLNGLYPPESNQTANASPAISSIW